ncbi:hypothetical protein GCM10027051_15340 [Niabella terrae]
MKNFLYALLLIGCSTGFNLSYGQDLNDDSTDDDPTTVDFNDKGLQFRKGKDFLLNFRFRTQLRAAYFSRTDDKDEAGYQAYVRRLRLRFEGHLLSPKLEYKIQLSFANRDMDPASGSPQIIRDAVFYYKPSDFWSIGLGQTKLPGNRERINSSGELQMPDRSIANSAFTVDRDFGIFIDRDFEIKNQVIQLSTAVSTGEGRGSTATDRGLAYSGRLEYMPLGYFKNKGDYFEGDLEFEETPKLALAFTYSKNFRARRTGGQLGAYMYSAYNTDDPLFADIRTLMADFVFKYQGWALMGEYYNRKADNFSVTDFAGQPDDELQFLQIPAGTAFNIQGSKMVSKKDEIALRYTVVRPHDELRPYQYLERTKAIGYSHYFNKHKFKIQGYLGLDDREGDSELLDDPFTNRLNGILQIEIGI